LGLQRSLQSKLYKGYNPKFLPKHIRRTIKRRLSRWKLRKIDLVHKLSRYIVELAKTFNAKIVFEDLSKIKERINKVNNKDIKRKIALSNYRMIQRFTEYKANWDGIEVIYVNPHKTSSICPFCSDDGALNTQQERELYCDNCGILIDRDVLATFNLLRKYLKCGVNKSLMSRSILTGKGILRGGWKAEISMS
jgi:putative transposase